MLLHKPDTQSQNTFWDHHFGGLDFLSDREHLIKEPKEVEVALSLLSIFDNLADRRTVVRREEQRCERARIGVPSACRRGIE